MKNFGLYSVDKSFDADCCESQASNIIPQNSHYTKRVRENSLYYNGDEIASVFNASDSKNLGTYIAEGQLLLNEAVVAKSKDNTKVNINDGVSFGSAVLVPSKNSSKQACINITAEDYAKLLCGKIVKGYKKYNAKDVYNIVTNVSSAETVYYDAEGYEELLYNNQTDGNIKGSNGNPIYYSADNDNTYKFTDVPFIGIRSFEPHIDVGGKISMPVYIDAWQCPFTHNTSEETVSNTFTVYIYDSFGNQLLKRTVYPGVTVLKFGPFKNGLNSSTNFEGETWFSLQVVDSRGVESDIRFFDVLIRNKDVFDWEEDTPTNWYQMTADDLVTYGITINNPDKYAGYRNKIGFTKLFNWCVSQGYKGVKLYEGSSDEHDHIIYNGNEYIIQYPENSYHYDSLKITKKGYVQLVPNGTKYWMRTDGCILIETTPCPVIPKCTYYISPHKNKNNTHSYLDVNAESIDLGSQTFYKCTVSIDENTGLQVVARDALVVGGKIHYEGTDYVVSAITSNEQLHLDNIEACGKVTIDGVDYPVIGDEVRIDNVVYKVTDIPDPFDSSIKYPTVLEYLREDAAKLCRDGNDKIIVWYEHQKGATPWWRRSGEVLKTETTLYYKSGNDIKSASFSNNVLRTRKDGCPVNKNDEIVIEAGGFIENLNIKCYASEEDCENDVNVVRYYIPNGSFYSVVNTAKHKSGDFATSNGYIGGDPIIFPSNFTVNLNGSTWRLTDCNDIRTDGNLIFLNGNIDTHIINGRVVGTMLMNELDKASFCLPYDGTGVFQEEVRCLVIAGRYCSFEDLDVSYSMGYEGGFTSPDYHMSPTWQSPSSLYFNTLGHIDNNGVIQEGQVIELLKSDTESTYPVKYVYDSTDRYVIRSDKTKILDGSNAISLVYTSALTNAVYTSDNSLHDVAIVGYTTSNGAAFANGGKKEMFFLHCYDENDTFIRTMKIKLGSILKLPTNTKSIRMSGYGVSVVDGDNLSIKLATKVFDGKYYNPVYYMGFLRSDTDDNTPFSSRCKSLETIKLTGRCLSKNNSFVNCHFHDTRSIAMYPHSIGSYYDNCKWERIAIEQTAFQVTKLLYDYEEYGSFPDRTHLKDCELVWGPDLIYNCTHPRFANDPGKTGGQMSTCHNFSFENCKNFIMGERNVCNYSYLSNCTNCGHNFITGCYMYTDRFRQIRNCKFLESTNFYRSTLGPVNKQGDTSNRHGDLCRKNYCDDFQTDHQTVRNSVIYRVSRSISSSDLPRSVLRLIDSVVLDGDISKAALFRPGADTYRVSDTSGVLAAGYQQELEEIPEPIDPGDPVGPVEPTDGTTIRVCSLNVGHFSLGNGSTEGTDIGYNKNLGKPNYLDRSTQIERWSRFFREINADIFGFTEWAYYFCWKADCTGRQQPFNPDVVDSQGHQFFNDYNYSVGISGYNNQQENVIAVKKDSGYPLYPQAFYTAGPYPDNAIFDEETGTGDYLYTQRANSAQCYIRIAKTEINNKEVVIAVTHLGRNNGSNLINFYARTQDCLPELLELFRNTPYLILMGDFNTQGLISSLLGHTKTMEDYITGVDEFDNFNSNGYTVCNYGRDKASPSQPATGVVSFNNWQYYLADYPYQYLDNIIVKGFRVNNFRVLDTDIFNDGVDSPNRLDIGMLTDHCALVADLTMIE